MILLFDTNIILDVLLLRKPFANSAAQIITYVELKRIRGLLGATTITTLYYLMTRSAGATSAINHIRTLLTLFDIAPIDGTTLSEALALQFNDFEDAVLHEAGRKAGATGIVTRDRTGFAQGTLPVYDPTEVLAMLRTLHRP